MFTAIKEFFLSKAQEVPAVGTADIVYRLHMRASIRRQIKDRKSVQEGKPDRIADILDEAANEIIKLREELNK